MFSTHRDFQVCEGDSYSCKWFSPLSKVEVVETDYHHDIWDYIVARGQRSQPTPSVKMSSLPMNVPIAHAVPHRRRNPWGRSGHGLTTF